MLYLIGLGLGDEKDITVKGLEAVRRSVRVYLEAYTSILSVSRASLEEFYGRPIIEADRELLESGSDEILEGAQEKEVSVLVVGDPFSATTHTDLVLRARELSIPVTVVHNASIITAVAVTGLQLYRFGQIVSIVFFTNTYRPTSFFEKIVANRKSGAHTLCLLDLKIKEQSEENLLRGRRIFEPPRYMTVAEAVQQLLEIENEKKEKVFDENTEAIGLARVGQPTQKIVAAPLHQLLKIDFGPPLHSLIIPAPLHVVEEEGLQQFRI